MHKAPESIKYQLISNSQNMLSVQCVEYSFVYKETCLAMWHREKSYVSEYILQRTQKRD